MFNFFGKKKYPDLVKLSGEKKVWQVRFIEFQKDCALVELRNGHQCFIPYHSLVYIELT
jgi:hypothetical protein